MSFKICIAQADTWKAFWMQSPLSTSWYVCNRCTSDHTPTLLLGVFAICTLRTLLPGVVIKVSCSILQTSGKGGNFEYIFLATAFKNLQGNVSS
jgi:hypothetical protein